MTKKVSKVSEELWIIRWSDGPPQAPLWRFPYKLGVTPHTFFRWTVLCGENVFRKKICCGICQIRWGKRSVGGYLKISQTLWGEFMGARLVTKLSSLNAGNFKWVHLFYLLEAGIKIYWFNDRNCVTKNILTTYRTRNKYSCDSRSNLLFNIYFSAIFKNNVMMTHKLHNCITS